VWSLKGSELQGGVTGNVEQLDSGQNDTNCLLVSIHDKPMVYAVPLMTNKGGRSVRSVLPGIVKCLASHPSGEFVFAAVENRILTWMITTGELLSEVDDNLQSITAMKISKCGSFLVSGSVEGCVRFYLTSDLIRAIDNQTISIKATLSHNAHSLSVQDLHITAGRNPRILSVSMDHSIALYSACSKKILMKVSTEHPLTACCMNSGETRVFFGTSKGKICAVDFFAQKKSKPSSIMSVGDEQKNNPDVAIFDQHSDEVCKLDVNFDGSRLASGDRSGGYCIWDTANGQCLVKSTMKGRITTLKFVTPWLGNAGDRAAPKWVMPLQSQVQSPTVFVKRPERCRHFNSAATKKFFQDDLDHLIDKHRQVAVASGSGEEPETSPTNKKRKLFTSMDDVIPLVEDGNGLTEQQEKIKKLEEEVARLVGINNELYDFMAKKEMGN